MPNSILDDIGFSDTQDNNTQQGDPAVWTLLGEAGSNLQGQLAVASTIANRAKLLKADYGQVVTDPSQGYEAWQDQKARSATQQSYPVGSDQYNQASQLLSDIKSGKVQALPYDSFYSPYGQAALKRPAPAFEDNKSGIDIGGNRFFNVNNKSQSHLDDLGFGDKALPTVDPKEAAQLAIDSENSKDTPNFPVYDPYNHVGRNADGSIAYIHNGTPEQYAEQKKQDATDTLADPEHSLHLTVGYGPDTNPERIAEWLKNHPDDLAHQAANSGAATPASDPAIAGIGQGLANVKNSIEGLAAPFSQGVRNDLVQGLLNRESNDTNLNSNLDYSLGKFGGELAATAPILAVPGLGELGEGALAGSKFAPVANFLGGNASGSLLTRGLSMGAKGALQGGEAGALTSAGSNQSLGQQIATGAAAGAVLNPLVEGGSNALGNLFTGGSTAGVSSSVAKLAKIAVDKYDIPITPLQIRAASGDRDAGTAWSELVGSDAAHAANSADQKTALTRAVAKTFGSDSDELPPTVMQAAKDRIGGIMNDVGSRTDITNTNDLLTKLHSILSDASQVIPDTELKPLLNQVKNISGTIQGDSKAGEKLSGQSYAALVAKNSALDRATLSPNSNIRHYSQQIRNALDDAVEAEANPDDVTAFRNARFQYKNMMTIKNLAAKANVEGEISPSLLNGAVSTNFKNRAFQGAGDLGELSQIGQTFMREPGNSFTKNRIWNGLKQFVPSVLGGAGMGIADQALTHPGAALATVGGAVTGAAIKAGSNAMKNASNLSPAVRNKFIKNILNGGSGIPSATPVNPFVPAGAILSNNLFQTQPQQKQGSK